MHAHRSQLESNAAASILVRVVELHEGIKSIVRGAQCITNEAINAMLRGKRGGQQALGFGAATAELRRFSSRLAGIMVELTAGIENQVADVAALRREGRMLSIQLRALAWTTAGSATMQAAIQRKERDLVIVETRVNAGQRVLVVRLMQAEKLCRIGLSIARAAKIEAVYGGPMAAGLRQVSDEIERHVDGLLETVKSLLRGTQAHSDAANVSG